MRSPLLLAKVVSPPPERAPNALPVDEASLPNPEGLDPKDDPPKEANGDFEFARVDVEGVSVVVEPFPRLA